jgi:hypothetical protein
LSFIYHANNENTLPRRELPHDPSILWGIIELASFLKVNPDVVKSLDRQIRNQSISLLSYNGKDKFKQKFDY